MKNSPKSFDKAYLIHYLPLKVNADGVLVMSTGKEVVDVQQKPLTGEQPPVEDSETLSKDALTRISKKLDDTNRVLDALLQSSNRIGDLIESFVKPASASKSLLKL